MTHTYFSPFLMYLSRKQTCCFSHTILTYCILKESVSCMCSLSWVSHYVSWMPGQPNLISPHVGEQKILGVSFLLHPLNPRGAVFHNCLPDTLHHSPCQSCSYSHPSWSDPLRNLYSRRELLSHAWVHPAFRRCMLGDLWQYRGNGMGKVPYFWTSWKLPLKFIPPEWQHQSRALSIQLRNESSLPACRHSHSFECYFETLSILPLFHREQSEWTLSVNTGLPSKLMKHCSS